MPAKAKNMTGKNPDMKVRANRVRVFKKVFGTEDGQSVLRYLCKRWHAFDAAQPPFTERTLAYREGTRAVILEVIRLINVDELELSRQVEEYVD